MIGSPFYYDVLFDDGPGDVVFHDCMWSGICTCCIQLLHQDSYQFAANESPDLKLENSHCRAQLNHAGALPTSTTTTSASSLHQHQTQLITANSCRIAPDNPAPVLQASARNSPDNPANSNISSRTCPDDSSSSSITATAASASRTASCLTSPDNSSSSASSSSSSSPAPAQLHGHHANSSSSLSPHCNSQSASPKPIRRREHNDSERKRRDHLRNAFNVLRDQVPRFKTASKKPPRIQILHEATKYVQIIMKESEELDRRLQAERAKYELNMKLS